ncbi:MAG: GDP-mannose 4,6-dehydratase [Chloroflexi bacterium]|nr:GDP-mannose 4,6-dehydratase [Chloroflexota bacterium]
MASDFSGRRVLVAGGAGFIGSQLVRELLADGARVAVLDNLLHGRREHLQDLGDAVQMFVVDITDDYRLWNAFNEFKPEFVFHVVGDTYVPTAYEIPKRFFKINLEGTINILLTSKMFGVERVLYVSSTEVYGEAQTIPMTEDHPLLPDNTYAVSKLAADRLCYTFQIEHDIPVVIARIYNSYGPRATEPYIIPEIVSQLSKGSTVRLGNIEARRDFTFVTDTARGLMATMASDIPNGQAVNIGSNKVFAVKELVAIIAEIMGHSDYKIEIDERRLRRKDIDIFQCDYTKLNTATGWKPTVELHEGLSRTIEWYRNHGSRWSWEQWVDGATLFDAAV